MNGISKSGDCWVDHKSLALMVNPDDVMKYRKEAHDKGLNVSIDKDGFVSCPSRSDHKKYCKAYGFVNYGDTW